MDFATARHNMVESQIRPNRVNDPMVFDAIADLPREKFVPKALQGVAYVDEDLDLGNGRYLMEPLALARLLDAASITDDDMVLVVGCSSGYEATVISKMAAAVVALESDKEIAGQATQVMEGLDVDTVAVVEGPLTEGYAKQAPYDVIFFNGAVAEIPKAIEGQLADGGRMLAVVNDGHLGKGTLTIFNDGMISTRELFDVRVPFLSGFEKSDTFSFS